MASSSSGALSTSSSTGSSSSSSSSGGVPDAGAPDAACAQPESCANPGVDNDCDGNTTELENGIPAGGTCVAGQGICAPGIYQCADGGVICQRTVSPGTESCSNQGTDDDCDGDTTEIADGVHAGDSCSTGLAAPCGTGTTVCENGSFKCQSPAGNAETCDNAGVDDNCDGTTDNIPNLGEGCNTGNYGICAFGTRQCDAFYGEVCSQTYAPDTEACGNYGTDDDCDGDEYEISDGIHWYDSCACSGATYACQGSYLYCDFGAQQPPSETCNGADDNCDGQTDESSCANQLACFYNNAYGGYECGCYSLYQCNGSGNSGSDVACDSGRCKCNGTTCAAGQICVNRQCS
ncbi:MAG: MopE-related protein [Myxococcota bacterium]